MLIPLQVKAANGPKDAPSRPAQWTCVISVALYLLVLTLGTARHFGHLDLVLALLQYGTILGGILWYLRSASANPDSAWHFPSRRLLFIVVPCFLVFAISMSWFSTRGLLNPDESGYSFQARIYKSGRIMADPLIGATDDVLKTPAELSYANHILLPFGWFPKFPPGWPLVLSLGYRISARWLPNPIFGALQLLVIAAIGAQSFSRTVGVLATFFAALSPFYLINSIGMMSHALCALLGATACLLLFIAFSTNSLRYYAAMFACLAATFQVRPYTAFVLTCVLSASAFWNTRKDRRQFTRVLTVGALFGALAIAGVVSCNHIYSGHWLVSPYAEAAGSDTPQELSFRPAVVLHGMMTHGPYMVLETLLGSFPFLHLLAFYALFREQDHRREVWILAALYGSLVLAYLAHPHGYAVFFGERFHFEAFFALVLLAARGAQLLIERWQARRGTIFALALLSTVQVGQLAFAIGTVSRQGEPYRKIRAAVASPDISGLFFLHDSPGFVAMHFNLNDADWRHAKGIYLVDADTGERSQWACRYGFSHWFVVSYDSHTHEARLEPGGTQCPISKDP